MMDNLIRERVVAEKRKVLKLSLRKVHMASRTKNIENKPGITDIFKDDKDMEMIRRD